MQDIAQKIVSESGNNFQCRVANYFRQKDWAVMLSPYYVDASSEKAREIDLVVEKDFVIPNIWSNGELQKSIRIRLFIECKYLKHGVVFWFDSMDQSGALGLIQKHSPFRMENIYINDHHYLKSGFDVAKLFASEHEKGSENDPMFRAVNQCLNGFVNSSGRNVVLPPRPGTTTLEYPIIVCSDFNKCYRTAVSDGEQKTTALSDNFRLEVNYAYISYVTKRPLHEYFLIDVVAFEFLDNFLKLIDDEARAAKKLIGDN